MSETSWSELNEIVGEFAGNELVRAERDQHQRFDDEWPGNEAAWAGNEAAWAGNEAATNELTDREPYEIAVPWSDSESEFDEPANFESD